MMNFFPRIDMKATGRRIRQLRMENKFTICDLGDELGISVQAISKWQSGMSMPTVDNLIVLAAIFHVRVEDILVLTKGSCLSCDGDLER